MSPDKYHFLTSNNMHLFIMFGETHISITQHTQTHTQSSGNKKKINSPANQNRGIKTINRLNRDIATVKCGICCCKKKLTNIFADGDDDGVYCGSKIECCMNNKVRVKHHTRPD